jgi:hypothetical protein
MAEARGGGKTDLRDPLTGVPSAAGALHPRGSSDAQAPRLEQTRSWGSSHPPTARSSGVPAGRAASRVVEPDLGWSSLSRPRRRGGRAGPPGGRACRDHWRTFAGLRPDERAGTPARSFLARPPDPGQPRPLVRAAPDSRDGADGTGPGTRVVEPVETTTTGWSSVSRPRHTGGRACRDHVDRVVERVETLPEGARSARRSRLRLGPTPALVTSACGGVCMRTHPNRVSRPAAAPALKWVRPSTTESRAQRSCGARL